MLVPGYYIVIARKLLLNYSELKSNVLILNLREQSFFIPILLLSYIVTEYSSCILVFMYFLQSESVTEVL